MIQALEGWFLMKITGLKITGGVVVAAVAMLLGLSRPAAADSYTILNLGTDNGRGIYGIDTTGDVVVWGGTGCGYSSPTCYTTYVNGVATSDTSTAPSLIFDDGTPCSSSPAGFNVSKSVCNNGWIGFGALFYPGAGPIGLYTGSGSDLDFLRNGTADQVFLNSIGDFAWDDGQNDYIYVAIRTPPPTFGALSFSETQEFVPADPSPEPSSLILAGTGLVLFVAALRRKANRRPASPYIG
jgi:hypothetical protein